MKTTNIALMNLSKHTGSSPVFSIFNALGVLLILGFIWGSGYSIARYAMTHGVSPLGYSFWQSLGPAIFLSILGIGKKNLRQSCKTSFHTKTLPYFLICGLLGIAIPNSNMYYTAAHVPAGEVALLVNTVPLFVYPIACLLKQESFSIERSAGVLMGFLGIFYLISPFQSVTQLSTTIHMTVWAWLTLLSPFCFALCSVYISHSRPSYVGVYTSSLGMLLTSTFFLTPLVWFNHGFYSLLPPFDATKYAILLEIFLSSIGYILFFYLVKYAGPVYYSLTGGIVGLTGIFWGDVLFEETLNRAKIISITMILCSILLISYNQYSQQKQRKFHAQQSR